MYAQNPRKWVGCTAWVWAVVVLLPLQAQATDIFNVPEALRRLLVREKQRERVKPTKVAAPKSQRPTRPFRREPEAPKYQIPNELPPVAELTVAQKRELNAIELVLRGGDYRSARRQILKFREKIAKDRKQPHRSPRAEAFLAETYLKEAQGEKAIELVGVYGNARDKYVFGWFDAYLQSGHAYLELSEYDKAAQIFDWLATSENGKDLFRQALATEGAGRAFLLQKKYKDAVEAFRFAKKALAEYEKQAKYLGEEARLAYIKSLRDRLGPQIAQAERDRDVELYTEAFVLYRDAERLRRVEHKYEEARKTYAVGYQRYPKSPYAEASRLYEIYCLEAMGARIEGVEKYLNSFYAKDAYGLYRGEALFALGRIAVERQVNEMKADRYFARLDAWIKEARKPGRKVEMPPIKAEAVPKASPPKSESKTDYWGNLHRVEIKPGVVINRATSNWYLDDLEEQCAKFRGFILFTQGKNDLALKQYKRVLELDPTLSDGHLIENPNDFTRLKWGAENGYLYAYPDDLKLYKDRLKFAVLLGDFYYVTQRFEKALGIYQRLLDDEFGVLADAQEDYPQFGMATCLYRIKGRNEAFRAYKKVFERRDGTFSEDRALYAAGNVGRFLPEEARRDESVRYWQRLIDSKKDSEYALKAWIGMAIHIAEKGQKGRAIDLLKGFPSKDEGWVKIVDHLVQKWSKAS